MITRAIAVAAGFGLCFCGTAFGRDSAHYVCSAVASFRADGSDSPIGISIVFDDTRGPGGNGRRYVLSWVYQGKLFQGSLSDNAKNFVQTDNWLQGNVAMKNGKSQLYAGTFTLEQQPNQSYALLLDGKITDDPTSTKFYPVKATLPCVHLSI
jgi:hypothetical protein